jgi:hypothetical protein
MDFFFLDKKRKKILQKAPCAAAPAAHGGMRSHGCRTEGSHRLQPLSNRQATSDARQTIRRRLLGAPSLGTWPTASTQLGVLQHVCTPTTCGVEPADEDTKS